MTYNIDTNSIITNEQAFQKINETIEHFNLKTKEYRKIKRQFANEFKSHLEIVLKNFFASSKTIKAISWSQFTPHFMDGDTCEFTIHEVYSLSYKPDTLSSHYKEIINEEKFSVSAYYTKNAHRVDSQELNDFTKIASLINDNEIFLEEIWGDHIIICATEEGIDTIEYYDHD